MTPSKKTNKLMTMKKLFNQTLLLGVLFIMFGANAVAQTAQNDSVFTEYYHTKYALKQTFEYNSQGNLSSFYYYSYDFLANRWEESTKGTYQFANNQHTGYISYTWDSETEMWEESTKGTYQFANNQHTGYISYTWDSETEMWEQSQKVDFTYDANGQTNKMIIATWDTENNTWKYYYTVDYDYQYNNYGNTLSSIMTMTGIVYSKSKTEYTYDNQNRQTSSKAFTWNDDIGDWKESSKTETTYETNTSTAITSTFTATQIWQESQKATTTLDNNGNPLLQETYSWNSTLNDWQKIGRTVNFVRGILQNVVNICPSSLGVKKGANLNVSVTEKPIATSRVWKYKRATETNYQTFSPSKTSATISLAFNEAGNYNVICESQIGGQTHISNEVSITVADVSIAPTAVQNLEVNQKGISLSVSESPTATSRRWYYAKKSGGPYTRISNTSTSYTPTFADPGTYYVVCQSTINNETIISNEVVINVSGISISPSATQVINPNQNGKTIQLIEMPTFPHKEWKFKTAKEGVWKSFYPAITGNSYTPNFPVAGEYYVACFSTSGTKTKMSNEAKIRVVEPLTINPIEKQIINTSVYGDTLKVYESSAASSRYWFYSITKGTYNNYVQPYNTTTWNRPYFTQPETYYIVCKSTWDGVQFTSNEVEINVIGNGITPEMNQSIVRGQKGNTLRVKESSQSSQREWKYKTTSTGDWQSFSPMQNATSLIPEFNVLGTYYVACFSTIEGITYSSNEVVIRVVEQNSIAPASNQQIAINTNINTLTVSETPTASSRYWWYSRNGSSYVNSYVSATTYQPKFEESGLYRVVCISTYDNSTVTSNEVVINVNGYPTSNFTVNVTPPTEQTIARSQNGEILTVTESQVPSSRAWRYSATSGGEYTSNTYNTSNTYRPNISTLGTFYVVCVSKFDTLTVASNEIKVNVVGNQISSTSIQTIPKDSVGRTLSVEEYPTATSREWKYKTSSNGVWNSFPISEAGINFSPKFSNTGEYYVACFSLINGTTYTTAEARVRVSANSIAPIATQNISVNTNGTTLTVTETYPSTTKEWYASTNANKEYFHYLGSGSSYTPKFSEPGTYYVACKSIWSDGSAYSNEVVVNVSGNNITSIFPQILPLNTNGTQLTVHEIPVATTREWKYKTSATGSWLSFSPIQTGVNYTPRFANSGIYYVACHSTIAGSTYISNEVVVTIAGNSITPATEQVIPQNTNGNLLNAVTTMPADKQEWYYSTASGSEYVHYLGSGSSYLPNFSQPGTYFIVCKSYFGNMSIVSNEVKISVAGNEILPALAQTIVVNGNGTAINVNEFPLATSREWKYKTTAGSWLSFSPKKTDDSFTPTFANVGTYQVACFSVIAGNTYTSNEISIQVVNNSIGPTAQQTLHSNQDGNILTVTESSPADKREWYYSTESGKNYNNRLDDGVTHKPRFVNAGTYFVVCKSTWGSATAISNEVKIVVLSNDPLLQNLNVSSGTLTPLFASNTFNYTVDVDNIVTSITFTATKNYPNQTIIGDGVHNLYVGSQTFDITVFSETGIYSQTYLITVNRSNVIKQNQTITWNQTLNAINGDLPITLNATASSGLAVSYTSDNTDVATVNGNILTIIGVGTATITASQGGNSTYNPAVEVPKTLIVTNSISIEQIYNGKLAIYPNPTQDMFFVDYEGFISIKLYDILGKEVLNQNINGKSEIKISHLPTGIYNLNIISNGKLIGNSKIVKQ